MERLNERRQRRAVERRVSRRDLGLHELAALAAAPRVAIVMMIVGSRGRLVVRMMRVRMAVAAAHDRLERRWLLGPCLRDMLVVPAATDDGMHQQRRGDRTGEESTRHGSARAESSRREAFMKRAIIKIDPRGTAA